MQTLFSHLVFSLSLLARAQIPSRSQHTTVRLPLPQVLLAINRRAGLVVLPGLGDLLDARRDERRQLKEVSLQVFLVQSFLFIFPLTLKSDRSGQQ